jgi:putative restriction endonuclease
MPAIDKYIHKVNNLNRGSTPFGKAPHKPILLITLIELIGKGLILNNKVYVDTELVGTFQENWRLLVNTLHQPDFTQPFYYLQSEKVNGAPLWTLNAKPGCQINSHIKSVNTLISVLDHGCFSAELFQYLSDPSSRNLVLINLLNTYFQDTQENYLENKRTGKGYLSDLEGFILNEPEVQYKTIKIETEEDVYVRGGLFKKLVPKVYNNSCCITGMRLESTFGHNFIDACHIVPFSVSHDDKVNNGIALCPNLHRAFDRGLITVDTNYKVIISKHVSEEIIHPYSLSKFNEKQIVLPLSDRYYPSVENLEWHRENVFKN